jgi:ATP synthase protein I
MTQSGRPPFDEFDEKLARLRPGKDGQSESEAGGADRLNWGSGLQAGVEIVAGVGGGLVLGWALDRWLDTRPLLLIICFILGAAAGLLNAYRFLRRYGGGPPDAGT